MGADVMGLFFSLSHFSSQAQQHGFLSSQYTQKLSIDLGGTASLTWQQTTLS